MGNKDSKSSKSAESSKPSKPLKQETKSSKYRDEYDILSWNEKGDVGLSSISTRPILNGKDIIFLSTSNKSTVYTIYNLDKSEFTVKSQQIECDSDDFDVKNTVYALHPDTNKIHFIEKNKDIKVLNLETNKIMSGSKSISNTNIATIQYNNGDLYIIGGDNYTEGDEEKKQEKEYIIIPYPDEFQMGQESDSFGRVLNIERDGINCIYFVIPSYNGWILKLLNNKEKHEYEWTKIHSPSSMKMFVNTMSVINYNNIYLILFGLQYIWILPLIENNEFGLKCNNWYELGIKSPRNAFFYAIYPPKDTNIHLFTYHGEYYTMKITDIMDRVKTADYNQVCDDDGLGKGSYGPKSKSIKSFVPKDDTAVDELLDGLSEETVNEEHKEYYREQFANINYENLQQIINDEEEMMGKIVKNEQHRKAIIEKAKELMTSSSK